MPDRDDPLLYRFGLEWEPASKLAEDCARAVANGYLHGISAFSRTARIDAVAASRTEVERHFRVVQTGRNPYHHTIAVPQPITDDVADILNRLFGRQRP